VPKASSSSLIVIKTDSASEPDAVAAIDQVQTAYKILALDIVTANTDFAMNSSSG
jgi:hypothetical protein